MHISVLAGDRRLDARQVGACPVDDVRSTVSSDRRRWIHGRKVGRIRKVGRSVVSVGKAVGNRHEVRLRALVVPEPRQSCSLRVRRGCRIRTQRCRQVLLETFNSIRTGPSNAPEQMDPVW